MQFWLYCDNVLHGNFGISYVAGQPVSTLIAQRLPRDAVLLGLSTLLALIIGVPMGLYQAIHHGTVRDDVVAGTWFTLYSAPDFMEALLLIAVFSVHFHVLQPSFPGGITSVGGLFADPNALVLPGGRALDQQRGRLQPVHAVLGDRGTGPGLHPDGAR